MNSNNLINLQIQLLRITKYTTKLADYIKPCSLQSLNFPAHSPVLISTTPVRQLNLLQTTQKKSSFSPKVVCKLKTQKLLETVTRIAGVKTKEE